MKVTIHLPWPVLLLAAAISPARADLNYYLYLEEEEQTTGSHRESSVVVLRSVGFLPLHESTPLPPVSSSVQDQRRQGCPEMVATDGGVNPNFLCVGPELREQAFYPVASAFKNPGKLPIRFSAFARSRGTPSGILVWKDAMVVPTEGIGSDGDAVLESVSMGPDTSKEHVNSDWLASTLDSANDNEVVAEWYLLTEEGGVPIRDGGLIRFIKGKPPSTDDGEGGYDYGAWINDEEDNGSDPTGAEAVSLTIRPAPTAEPMPHIVNHCLSLTEILCSDEHNDVFGTFCSLLMQVGLDTVFSVLDGNHFTVFAPTNAAFAQAYADRPQPALLPGHDLTRLLLTHVVVAGLGTNADQSQFIGTNSDEPVDGIIRYEDMVCGTKQEMASDQVTKIGCDENAEVTYLIGPGNTGQKPKFLDVDRGACNGVLHSLDFVVMPGTRTQAQQDFFGTTVDLGNLPDEPDVSMFPDAATTNTLLRESDVLSFFQATVQDFAEEDAEDLAGIDETEAASDGTGDTDNSDNDNEEPAATAVADSPPPATGTGDGDDDNGENAGSSPVLTEHFVTDWVIRQPVGKPFDTRTVHAGDSMTFSWDYGVHDVWIYPSGNCGEQTGKIQIGSTSDNPTTYTFREDEAGTTVTFVCDVGSHCQAGMILDVVVLPPAAGDEDNNIEEVPDEPAAAAAAELPGDGGTTTTTTASSTAIDTQSKGFHSFFDRPGVAKDLDAVHGAASSSSNYRGRTRPGNSLRRRR